MKKEEQIREIIIEMHPCYLYHADPSPREIAKQLYESGYRKADEVRKETAQKVIKPYQHERFGKNGQTYSLKCGRCNKTVQTKWNYCPFCGAKLREVEE